MYSAGDLRRLQQVLLYRELEFGLDEIAGILADPDADTDDHLRRQHRLMRARRDRVIALLGAIEREMEARKMGMALTPEEQFELFGTDNMDEVTAEAEERWGDTDAWRESRRRAAAYTKEDWVTIKAEADANIAGFADAIRAETKHMKITVREQRAGREHIDRLRDVLRQSPGACSVQLVIQLKDGCEADLSVSREYRVEPSDVMLSRVEKLLGEKAVELR